MGQKRIFVAVPISEALQDAIWNWHQAFEDLPVRWIEGKNLHITLVPPWYENDVPAVLSKLRTVRDAGPFVLDLARVAYGPDPRSPRLIWAEGRTPSGLTALKKSIELALSVRFEERPFRLHLTLARFRPERFSNFAVRTMNENVAWREPVRTFVLMESQLLPTGADYDILEEFPL